MSEKLSKYQKIDHIAVKVTYAVALVILGVLVIWGIHSFIHFWNYEETNDAQVREYINPILSRSSGYVQQIRYTDHQQVKKGDTLVVLDQEEAMVHLQEAEAALCAAQAQLEVLQSNVNTANGSEQVDYAKIKAAKARLWQQQQEFERYEKLVAEEAVTQQRFEEVKTRLEVAKAEFKAIENGYSVSQNRTFDVQSQIAVAKANIEQKQAAVNRVKLDLKYAVIVAPANGFMGIKKVQQGQYIQRGQTIGFMVDKDQGKWIEANFEETQIASMQIGRNVIITVDAYPDQEYHGTIVSFSPATGSQFSLFPQDNATGNFVKVTQRFPVRINFTDPNESLEVLHTGMNAEVSVAKM